MITYYLGLFSIIPVIGLFFGAAAVVLSIIGWRNRKRRPAISGGIHAWIGIIGATFGFAALAVRCFNRSECAESSSAITDSQRSGEKQRR